MTLATLYPPIAAATILNVFLFALYWRSHQVEKRAGSPPLALWAGWLLYVAAIGAFLIFSLKRPLTSGADIFGAAVLAEAWGGAVVYALLNAFVFQRDQPIRVRGPAMAGAILLLGFSIAGMF